MTHNQYENFSQIPCMLELADKEFKVTIIIRFKILQKKIEWVNIWEFSTKKRKLQKETKILKLTFITSKVKNSLNGA